MSNPNPRYNLYNLPPDTNPSPEWLARELAACFGDHAASFGLEFLAKYRYTDTFADWACVAHQSEDVLPIEGQGLEIIVMKPWIAEKATQQMVIRKGNLLVKDHSPDCSRINLFYDMFRQRYFEDAVLTTISVGNETPSGVPTFRIGFRVYLHQQKIGGQWVLFPNA